LTSSFGVLLGAMLAVMTISTLALLLLLLLVRSVVIVRRQARACALVTLVMVAEAATRPARRTAQTSLGQSRHRLVGIACVLGRGRIYPCKIDLFILCASGRDF
jgi:hypothetical protein